MVCGTPGNQAHGNTRPKMAENLSFDGKPRPKNAPSDHHGMDSAASEHVRSHESHCTFAVAKSLRTPSESFRGRVVSISVLQPLTSPKAELQLLPPTFPAARIVRPTGGPRGDLAPRGGFFIGRVAGFWLRQKGAGSELVRFAENWLHSLSTR